MRLQPRPTVAIVLSVSLLIQGVGCSSSGSSIADPPAPMAYQPTREALSTLDTGTKVVVVRKDSTALMGWFEGIEEPRSGSIVIEDSSLFRVVLRYRPDYGTFQGFSRTPSDSIDRVLLAKDATTDEKVGGLVIALVVGSLVVGALYLMGLCALSLSQGS